MIRQGIPDILRGAVWIKLTSDRRSSVFSSSEMLNLDREYRDKH